MKTISLNKGTLELPDCWEDLSLDETLKTIGVLMRLFSGKLDPDTARIEMLMIYTGYKPNPRIKDTAVRENINFNLLRLAEQLNFAFTIEEIEDETKKRIVPHFDFKRNPMSVLKIGGTECAGKIFNLDITAKTDIFAKEFIDAFDLYVAIGKFKAEADKEECLNQLCAVLYPGAPDHRKNLVSGQIENMRSVDHTAKILIYFWFSGIVYFYTEHPVYSVLFSGRKEKDEDKIDLGMNAIALHLTKEGYGNAESMPLNDYFDAQVQSLKDTINKALSSGLKIAEIAQKTGILPSTIEKLS